jgi:hypothetical protein
VPISQLKLNVEVGPLKENGTGCANAVSIDSLPSREDTFWPSKNTSIKLLVGVGTAFTNDSSTIPENWI